MEIKIGDIEFTYNLDFSPKDHLYSVHGDPIPSVTTILTCEYPIPEFVKNRDEFSMACEFGKAVHEATECDDLGKDRPIEIIGGVYDAADLIKAYNEEHEVKVLAVEIPVYSSEWWYAGTIDRINEVNFSHMCRPLRLVVDYKTSELGIKGKIQIAAYILALEELGVEVDGGMLLSVRNGEIKTAMVKPDHFKRWEKIMRDYNMGVYNVEEI